MILAPCLIALTLALASKGSAESLLKEDLYEDALAAATVAVQARPDDPRAHVAMADALYRRGDFDEAERRYRLAAQLDPANAAAHFGIGRILRTLGRYGEAAEEFSRAATLAPEVPKYLRTLANHLARREDALGMYRRYLEIARQAPGIEEESMIRNVEAWVALLVKMGDRPISEIARSEPCEIPIQVALGQAYIKMRVAGLKSQRFVFDSGATGVTISPRIAARAKLESIRPFAISGTGARRTETGDLVVVPEIALGAAGESGEPIVIRNVPATVRDPAGPEEGLIGPSVLSAFDVTVDMKKGRLRIEAPADARPGRSEPFRNVGGQIMIVARLNGVSFNAMVDTGAASTIVGKTTLRRVPGLVAVPTSLLEGSTLGVGGALADRKRILKGTFSFADRDYTAAGLLSGDLSGFSHAMESEVYVILGTQHLDDTPFTISYKKMTVTFMKQGGSPYSKGDVP
jgi:predicted aspartyl protease